MTLDEEKDLLNEIRESPGAFGVLFDLYYKGIFGYVFRRLADYDLARDVASETFLKAFTGIGRFRQQGISISFWLYRIATNEINAHFRKLPLAPFSLNSLLEQGIDLVPRTEALEEREALEYELARHEEYRSVLHELRKMPIRYQEVIALRYFERKSIKDIGEILGKREGTVKSLLFRGIEKLRRTLAPDTQLRPRPESEGQHE